LLYHGLYVRYDDITFAYVALFQRSVDK